MQLFRAGLVVAWLLVALITVKAVIAMGANEAGAVFIGDFGHPWRAQFNCDFSVHLFLMAGWMVYREPNLLRGLLFGLAAIIFGGLFSLAYILVATFAANGRFDRLFLGHKRMRSSISQDDVATTG